jgi:hypothetical protein
MRTVTASLVTIFLPDDGSYRAETCKGKAIPPQAWTGPEGSRRLSLPDFKQSAHESGMVVSPTTLPPLPLRKYSMNHFC